MPSIPDVHGGDFVDLSTLTGTTVVYCYPHREA